MEKLSSVTIISNLCYDLKLGKKRQHGLQFFGAWATFMLQFKYWIAEYFLFLYMMITKSVCGNFKRNTFTLYILITPWQDFFSVFEKLNAKFNDSSH